MVYFVQGVDGGPIKIGYTTSMEADGRLAGLQCGSPVQLRVLHTVRGNQRLERELHVRFAVDRLHGEWFRPSDDLLYWLDCNGAPEALVRAQRSDIEHSLERPWVAHVDPLRVLQEHFGRCGQWLAAKGCRCGALADVVLHGPAVPSERRGPRCATHAGRFKSHELIDLSALAAKLDARHVYTALQAAGDPAVRGSRAKETPDG